MRRTENIGLLVPGAIVPGFLVPVHRASCYSNAKMVIKLAQFTSSNLLRTITALPRRPGPTASEALSEETERNR